MIVKVNFVRSTDNYLCFEGGVPDMDFREKGIKCKLWIPKSEIEPRGHMPAAVWVEVHGQDPTPVDERQTSFPRDGNPTDEALRDFNDDDVPF